jgi:hypothetical protein
MVVIVIIYLQSFIMMIKTILYFVSYIELSSNSKVMYDNTCVDQHDSDTVEHFEVNRSYFS